MNGDFEIKEQKTPVAGKSPTGAERAQPSMKPENRPRRAARRIPEIKAGKYCLARATKTSFWLPAARSSAPTTMRPR